MIQADDHEFLVLAYGNSPFLENCLASLKRQTVTSRVRIATSTPSAHIDVLARTHGVDLLVNPARHGIGRDWNFALEQAERRYVTLAHQDDLYRPDFVERTLTAFHNHPQGRLAFTSHDQVDDAGRVTWSKISLVKQTMESVFLGSTRLVSPARMKWFLSFGNPVPCSSVTLDLDNLTGFRFSEVFASNLDWDAWLRLCRERAAFLHVPERLVGRRHNGLTETSRLIRDGRRRCEDLEIFRRTLARPFTNVVAAVYAAAY